jgi:hypothetical protein
MHQCEMKIAISLLLIALASCSARESSRQISDAFLPGRRIAELNNKNLKEISGIAASINNPKHFWVHNDAGNKAEVYLLDESLQVKLICQLTGIENRDWEDIAVGPGPDPDKQYVYIGDIGDNDAKAREKYIYRFEEPVLAGDSQLEISVLSKITFQLEGGSKDTETLLLDPKTKNLYIVSKREVPVHLYELKFPYDENVNTALRLASLPMTRVVGGDFSSDGDEIVLKNYDQVFYWKSDSTQSVAERLTSPAVQLPYEKEPQGEAITWANDGSGFYTISEVIKGENVYLYFYERNKAR